jgi:hypothetical protein
MKVAEEVYSSFLKLKKGRKSNATQHPECVFHAVSRSQSPISRQEVPGGPMGSIKPPVSNPQHSL